MSGGEEPVVSDYPDHYKDADNESKMMYDLEKWHPELGEIPVEDFVLSYASLFKVEDWEYFRSLKIRKDRTYRQFRTPFYKEIPKIGLLAAILGVLIVILFVVLE